MKIQDTDKEESNRIVVALAFFVVGFAATFAGVYLMVSLGAALTVGGLFLLVVSLLLLIAAVADVDPQDWSVSDETHDDTNVGGFNRINTCYDR